jgi:hypothetical protein
MDESPRQLIGEVKVPIPPGPSRLEKIDYEYERKGRCNIFMASEPLIGKRMVKITEHRKIPDRIFFAILRPLASPVGILPKMVLSVPLKKQNDLLRAGHGSHFAFKSVNILPGKPLECANFGTCYICCHFFNSL